MTGEFRTGAWVFGILLYIQYSVQGAQVATTTFDSNMDGWTSNNPDAFWDSPGGNPGGYVRFDDATAGFTNLYAPAKFLGDWSELDGGGSISYDFKMIDIGPGSFHPHEILIFGSDGEQALWYGPTPTGPTDWLTIRAPLDEIEWSISGGNWATLLSHVTELRIRMDHTATTPDIEGLDNVVLIPEPASLALLVFGGPLLMRRRKGGSGLLPMR